MSEREKQADFELRRKLLQMEMLYEIGVALNGSLDPTEVAEEILQRGLVMVDAGGAALLVRDDEASAWQLAGCVGAEIEEAELFALAELDIAWRERRLLQGERKAESWQFLCVVPLLSSDAISGVLIVADREERGGKCGPFDEDHLALLRSFAGQAGTALHNARLHRRLENTHAQLQQAQRKLAQLEQLRALGDLAAELTHAMRHMLGVIVGRADLYLSLGGDPEQTLRAIVDTAEEGQQLVERIQRSTRLGVGRSREQIDMAALLEEAIADARAWDRQRDDEGEIVWHIQIPALPTLRANRADIKEVFVNLLINSMEALSVNGEVGVFASAGEEGLDICVRDNGCGMSEKVRERIFDPFFTTKEETGSGLGLSIVYRIVDDHGGEIVVDSAPGEGCAIAIKLPFMSTAPASEEEHVEIDIDR